jgi:hypothetical protein
MVDSYERENEERICGFRSGVAKDLSVVGYQSVDWRWRNYDLSKCWQLFGSQHSVLSQETFSCRDNESFSSVKNGWIINIMCGNPAFNLHRTVLNMGVIG